MALGLWVSSVVYLLLLEPTVYFPEELGLPEQHEVIFVHNAFMVQFMYDRLPLYIVALYPAMITLSFEAVRAFGVFTRRGLFVGAVCVGAVHHAFYEVFDHLGPQLRWWVWAPEARSNHLMFGAVPVTSNVLFATMAPIVLVLFAHRLLSNRADGARRLSSGSMLARSFLAGTMMLPALGLLGAPWIAGVARADADLGPVVAVGFGILTLMFTVWMAVDAWRTPRGGTDAHACTYVEMHGGIYLVTFFALWWVALPDYFEASNGVTSDGTAIGSLPYALACFLGCAVLLVTVAHRARASRRPEAELEPRSIVGEGTEPMENSTGLCVRRIPFDFEGVPFQWNPKLPRFGLMMNTVGIIAIAFEKYLVSAVRQAMPRITDAAVAEEAEAFLRQEAQHSLAHQRHIRALARANPGVKEVLEAAIREYDTLLEEKPLEFHLAYIADLEATFTPVFKLWLDHHDVLFRSGDERVASLFLWHFVEEVEHRSSALILYDHVVDDPWYRAKMALQTFRHVGAVYTGVLQGIQQHVPLAERMADTGELEAAGIWRREFSSKLLGRGRGHEVQDGGMFPGASAGEVARTLYRLVLSQVPNHDPAHQPLPAFADRWFEAFDRGADVTRWYSKT